MGLITKGDPVWLERLQRVPLRQRLVVAAGAGLLFTAGTEGVGWLFGWWLGWLVGLVASGAFAWGALSWFATARDGRVVRALATVAGTLGGGAEGGVIFAVVHAVSLLEARDWPVNLSVDAAREPWVIMLAALASGWGVLGALIGATTRGKRGVVERSVLAVAGAVGGVAAGGSMWALVWIWAAVSAG